MYAKNWGKPKLLRRGRLQKEMSSEVSEYTSSMKDDVRIFDSVVKINIAHIIMLHENGIIPKDEAAKIVGALRDLHARGIGALELAPELEDIHMAVEKFVISSTGEKVGGKLNTAKSRNDQVATAIRMTLKKELLGVQFALLDLLESLMSQAERNVKTIMPGYTHLQVAQPTTFAHHLMAHAFAFLNDFIRLSHALEATDACPMGACALAGTSFPIDRKRIAELLGFKKIVENTMDAVSSRDFVLQAMSCAAILMTNLSRLAEEIVLWSTSEFGMIEVPDEFAATSSIMPQKKNPVVAEIARARAGHVIGDLFGAFEIMKALPQSYSLDMQDLTPLLWDAMDMTAESLKVMSKLVAGIKPNPVQMRRNAERGFSTATELADELTRISDMSFREAHAVVGRMVAKAIERGKNPQDITLEDLIEAHVEVLGKKVEIDETKLRDALNAQKFVEARNLPGGPSPKEVKRQISRLKKLKQRLREATKTKLKQIEMADERLLKLFKF
ncbi:MAG: hypothetical protein APU95_00075 [Hadesarchaea archaeon YNP_N21]|nr:MAG: hypothetical protein APU95_00075 [Hadesarchaea archaeon YNP_N21]